MRPRAFSVPIDSVQEDPRSRLESYSAPPNIILSQPKAYSSLDGRVGDTQDKGLELCGGNIPALVAHGV